MKIKLLSIIAVFSLFAGRAYSYGPPGHEMVGAIADVRLAGTPTALKISKMLGGVSLQQAAILPDKIKDWDNNPPDATDVANLTSSKKLGKQFLAFWKANPKTMDENNPIPYHRWFHYTDVPVADFEKYRDGTRGRSNFDIVHMIPFCIGVLKGDISEQNPRKITKPVAVALLAHYMGDIHQPLHVGAEYFDASGNVTDPDKNNGDGAGDNGGNNLILVLDEPDDNGTTKSNPKLHGFWDDQAVSAAFAIVRAEINPNHEHSVKTQDIVHHFASREPANWKLSPPIDVKDWAEAWANEIMPLARQAHERLEFSGVHGTKTATGIVTEKKMTDNIAYRDWAGGVVKDELHKAGWRLADLLEQILK